MEIEDWDVHALSFDLIVRAVYFSLSRHRQEGHLNLSIKPSEICKTPMIGISLDKENIVLCVLDIHHLSRSLSIFKILWYHPLGRNHLNSIGKTRILGLIP